MRSSADTPVVQAPPCEPSRSDPTVTPDGRWQWDGEMWIESTPKWPPDLRRPRLAWWASITPLWILTWWHPWGPSTDLRISVFALACFATVVFGAVLRRRGHPWLIRSAAFSATFVLAVTSVLALGVGGAIRGGPVAFFGSVLFVTVLGSPVICAAAVSGFWLLVLLLWSGSTLAKWRRRH